MSAQIQLPDLETLFGSTSFCPCEECGSVLSPAAYLVDVLHSILESKIVAKDAKNVIVNNGVDILFGRRVGKNGEDIPRRPDIENIELTCQNTTTPVPYVDLVNEVLENAVAPLVDWSKPLSNEDRAKLQTKGTAEEVASNPDRINNAAYDVLKQAVYPPTLPLNLPLELDRTYLEHLGSSRHQVMQTFQRNSSPSDLAIALEYLKISDEEAAILTGTAPNSLPEFYGYAKTFKISDLINQLGHVPEFLNRTSVTFAELIELTRTHFLNPDQAITLHVPDNSDPCNLDNITVTNLDEAKLSKIHRFIRLCRKLGWQIHDLDLTLTTTKATDIDRDLLMKLALITRLQTDLRLPLHQLLTFWGNIDTYGDDSLYARLFQNKVVLNPVDQAFALTDDRSDLLAKPEMSEHLDTIVAALQISSADLAAIRTDAGLADTDQNKPVLSLANLSNLYRHALLAKALSLSVNDLITLLVLIGGDPFPAGTPAATLKFLEKVRKVRASSFSVAQLNYLYRHVFDPNLDVAPLRSSIDLLIQTLQTGLKKIVHDTTVVSDPRGDVLRQKLALVLDTAVVERAMNLLAGTAVHSTPLASLPIITFPDPVSKKISYDGGGKQLRFTDAMSLPEKRQLLSLSADVSYQNAINDLFQKSQVGGNVVYSVPLADLPSISFRGSLSDKISFDAAAKQLRFTGFMTDAESALLPTLSTDPGYGAAVGDLLQQLQQTRSSIKSFISANMSAFLDTSDAGVSQIINSPQAERFDYVLTSLMGSLRDSLSRSLVKQTVSDSLKLDSALAQLLLETVVKSRTDPKQGAIADFLVLSNGGISASYHAATDLTGIPIRRIDRSVNFDWGDTRPAAAITPPNFSVRWTGRALAQSSETYAFYARVGGGVRLWVAGQLLINQWTNQTVNEFSGSIDLEAGQLYDVKMEVTNAKPRPVAQLSWSSPSVTKAIIPQGALYPTSVFNSLAWLHKVALLVNTFQMTVREVAYLSTHSADFANFDLNALPVDPSGFDPALFTQWLRLRDLFALRDSLPQGEVGLLDVFAAASADLIDVAKAKFALVTGWDRMGLEDLAGAAGFKLSSSDFKNEIKLVGLQAARILVRRLGVSAAQLFSWAANEPDAGQADAIRKTVKAKYDDAGWLAVAKPLQDVLREKRRSALVSFLIGNPKVVGDQEFLGSNDLFDYFLIDVEMSPCQMTSRIKQAISSVQLFVQRCLMNLERYPFKDPNGSVSIDPEGVQWWQWMKNYRVWEANRKIFLYPEDWIQTELLPDKSSLFGALENRLLQGDITADSAEDAFREYLEKLDQVARLEVIGLYHEQATQQDPETPDVLHVFGRTWSVPHIYFYRRRVQLGGSAYWTAWEKVDVDIQGEHLIPVVWNRRLHIFWPIFTEKAVEGGLTIKLDKELPPPEKYWEIQLAWSEYKKGKWTGKSLSSGPPLKTDPEQPTMQVQVQEFIFKASVDKQNELTVECIINRPTPHGLQGKVTVQEGVFHSSCIGTVLVDGSLSDRNPLLLPGGTTTEGMMVVERDPKFPLHMLAGTSVKDEQEETVLLNAPSRLRLLYPQQEIDQFLSQDSFFYQDDKRSFFVEPEHVPIVEKWHMADSVTPAWGLEPPIYKQTQVV